MPESELLVQITTEAERQAFELFPALVASTGADREALAVRLADLMGNPGEFQTCIEGSAESRERSEARLLRMFKENVELLVHKTWVEKNEEKPKERLLVDLDEFIGNVRSGQMHVATLHFIAIARSIATLLFGAAGRAPDFIVYAFRIDPKLGLFFWYVGELENMTRLPHSGDTGDLLKLQILIGIFTLSCF